jgi:hypothetical protein
MIRGLPFISLTFFLGILFEPPLAGIIANIFITALFYTKYGSFSTKPGDSSLRSLTDNGNKQDKVLPPEEYQGPGKYYEQGIAYQGIGIEKCSDDAQGTGKDQHAEVEGVIIEFHFKDNPHCDEVEDHEAEITCKGGISCGDISETGDEIGVEADVYHRCDAGI